MDLTSVLSFLANHLLDIVGGASALALLLRNLLPPLEAYANSTISDADNRFVEGLGVALALLTALLDVTNKAASAVGLNPAPEKEESAPVEVVIEVDKADADESSDGSL